MLFNFRRGNECAAMQVKTFQQRDDWKSGNQEIYQSLTSVSHHHHHHHHIRFRAHLSSTEGWAF